MGEWCQRVRKLTVCVTKTKPGHYPNHDKFFHSVHPVKAVYFLSMAKTNIACAQIDCVIGRPEINRQKIIDQTRTAAERGARLVVFPECAISGYAFESLEEAFPFAETIDGPSS